MEIHAACEDVGAGEASEGELGTIGATTDGLYPRSNATCLHGVEHNVDDVHRVGLNFLLHVVILIFQFQGEGALAVLLVHLPDTRCNEVLAVFKTVSVVVADDVVEAGILNMALNGEQVEESLIALSGLRGLVKGQHGG